MKKKVLSTVWEYLVITLACAIFAFCWECFMIPNGMSAGGLMGLCTVIQFATGGVIQASYSYVVINALLILIALLAMGIGFGVKTLFSIAMSSVMLELFSGMEFLHAVPGNFFFVPERVLIPVLAGVLEAVGVGLIIRKGGSTGGTDIIALMVNKYWPVALSRVFLLTDFIIICSQLLLPDKTFGDCVYGLEMMVSFSLVIDFAIGGQKTSYQLLVFSEKFKEIADYIIGSMDRGVTIVKAQGWYTKKDRDLLLILISQKQLPELTKVIKEIDPKAFMSINRTSNVYGEGFEEIKAGVKLRKKKNEQ